MSNVQRVDSHETRIALLEQTIGHINQTLTRLENKMDKGFLDVKQSFKDVDKRLDGINNRIWFNFYWGIAGFASVLAVMAHAFHWIL